MAPPPLPPSRQRLRAPERREQLLASANRIVERTGFETLTMERVAAEAGVSKPVVYNHFANADEVAAAVARREVERLDREVAARMATAETFDDRLSAMIDPYLDAFLAPRSVLRRLALQRPNGGARQEATDGRLRQVLGFITDEISRHFEIPPRDAGLAAATLYAGFEGASTYALVTRADRADVDRVLHAIIDGGLRELAERSRPAVSPRRRRTRGAASAV